MGKGKHITQVIIPVLLKFKDDKVSIPSGFMEEVRENFTKLFTDKKATDKLKEYKLRQTEGYQYYVNHTSLSKWMEGELKDSGIDYSQLEIYYYHHRVILKYSFSHKKLITTKLAGGLRKKVTTHGKDTIEQMINIINTINTSNQILFESPIEANNCKIQMYYSYPIIIQDKSKDYLNIITNRLETMFFKVYLPNLWPFSFGSETFVRISIPAMNIFKSGTISKPIEADFINAVYQEILYQKKIKDKEFAEKLDEQRKANYFNLDKETVSRLNRIDESILKNMWEYSIDTLSGRISDHQQSKVSRNTYILGGVGFIIALAGLFLSVFASF